MAYLRDTIFPSYDCHPDVWDCVYAFSFVIRWEMSQNAPLYALVSESQTLKRAERENKRKKHTYRGI